MTPSYNQGIFIERTLRSVAEQGVDYDHLVFDGGSTDDTVEILRRFDRPITWVSQKDGGQADAVNRGFRVATGDIIGWLNSDDVYYPGALARVVAYFEAHPEVDVVYGMADHIDRFDRPYEKYPTVEWDPAALRDICFISQPAAFLRRRVVEQHLLDDQLHYCMDYEYWLRLGGQGVRFGYLPEKLAGSRMYGENKTNSRKLECHAEINDMLKRTLGSVPEAWLGRYGAVVVDRRVDWSESHPLLFEYLRTFQAMVAALRWNRRVSTMLLKIHYWNIRRTMAGN